MKPTLPSPSNGSISGAVDNATKRPWKYNESDNVIYSDDKSPLIEIVPISKYVGIEERKANARLIVKAVNCHDELVEALKQLNRSSDEKNCWCEMAIGNPMARNHSKGCLMAKEALSKAEAL